MAPKMIILLYAYCNLVRIQFHLYHGLLLWTPTDSVIMRLTCTSNSIETPGCHIQVKLIITLSLGSIDTDHVLRKEHVIRNML